jgi:D-sedoheptulose 7-phosphate isomerase
MRRTARTARERGPLERQARASLRTAARTLARVERRGAAAVAAASEAMIACLQNGGTVFFCGNGGSAADAQHLACELAGRYLVDRPGLAAIALSTNTSALTAIGNDFGFEQVFSRQLEGLGRPGDVLVAITTSGGSPNVVHAVHTAHTLGMIVIGMTGERGRRFAGLCDHALITPETVTPLVQTGHIAMGHTMCELVERAVAGRGNGRTSASRGASKRGSKTRGTRAARLSRRGTTSRSRRRATSRSRQGRGNG